MDSLTDYPNPDWDKICMTVTIAVRSSRANVDVVKAILKFNKPLSLKAANISTVLGSPVANKRHRSQRG